jgi:hypothetical protein
MKEAGENSEKAFPGGERPRKLRSGHKLGHARVQEIFHTGHRQATLASGKTSFHKASVCLLRGIEYLSTMRIPLRDQDFIVPLL